MLELWRIAERDLGQVSERANNSYGSRLDLRMDFWCSPIQLMCLW